MRRRLKAARSVVVSVRVSSRRHPKNPILLIERWHVFGSLMVMKFWQLLVVKHTICRNTPWFLCVGVDLPIFRLGDHRLGVVISTTPNEQGAEQ